MADIKPVSFRILEEDQEKFKQFASESGFNQAEAFKSLINTWEMAQAKTQIGDRAKDIETFQETINNLMGMFINSLAMNQTSEERIRGDLSLELNTKDLTIQDLQTERNKLKENFKSIEETNKELLSNNKALNDEVKKIQKELDIKIETDKNQQEQISTLNGIVTEYKGYKEINNKLDSENKRLLSEIAIKDNAVKQLEGELKNNADMISFYKEQLDSSKEETKSLNKSISDKENSYKADIKALEDKHKEDIAEAKESYKSTLESKVKEYQEQLKKSELEFKEKLDFELQKKQLEMDKLKNELDHTKKSSPRASATKNNNK
jgi:chromosome segregation ATPase